MTKPAAEAFTVFFKDACGRRCALHYYGEGALCATLGSLNEDSPPSDVDIEGDGAVYIDRRLANRLWPIFKRMAEEFPPNQREKFGRSSVGRARAMGA